MKKLAFITASCTVLFIWIYADKQQDTAVSSESSHHTTIKDLLAVNCCENHMVQVCQDTTYCQPVSAIRFCELEDYRDCYIWPAINTKR